MPFVTAPDGVRLHYELEGNGPPLLLHLGAGCDCDLWRAAGYVEPLAKKYQCILFDHRGHGTSDRPREVAANHIDRYVDDVGALLDHLRMDWVHFWGWSNAMFVACAVAERFPARVRSLILGGAVAQASRCGRVEGRRRREDSKSPGRRLGLAHQCFRRR